MTVIATGSMIVTATKEWLQMVITWSFHRNDTNLSVFIQCERKLYKNPVVTCVIRDREKFFRRLSFIWVQMHNQDLYFIR